MFLFAALAFVTVGVSLNSWSVLGVPAERRLLAFGETALRHGFRHKIDLYCWTDIFGRLLMSSVAVESLAR